MENKRFRARAFKIITKSNGLNTDLYVVIAHTYAEAEDIYWKELNGYQEILSIEEIPDTVKVGFKITDKEE